MFTLPNPSHQGRGLIINPLPLWERARVRGKIDFCKSLSILEKLEVVDDRNIALKYRKEAYNLNEDIDPTDAIFVALALFLNAKLWSGDKRLKEGLENKGRHND
jgi:predicted nucleic acid-binding protein